MSYSSFEINSLETQLAALTARCDACETKLAEAEAALKLATRGDARDAYQHRSEHDRLLSSDVAQGKRVAELITERDAAIQRADAAERVCSDFIDLLGASEDTKKLQAACLAVTLKGDEARKLAERVHELEVELATKSEAIQAIAYHVSSYPGRDAIIEAIGEIASARNKRADECLVLKAERDSLNAKLVEAEADVSRVAMFDKAHREAVGWDAMARERDAAVQRAEAAEDALRETNTVAVDYERSLIDSFGADIARLEAERNEWRNHTRNLLARIHCDDGHYTEQHGLDKSIEDAHTAVAEAFAERDSLNAKLAMAEANEIKLNAAFTNTCRDLFAKRDAAVQRAEAAEQTLALVEVSENTQAADTERRVVEEIAVLLASMTNEQGLVSGMHAAAAVRAGAYRKQGARDV